MTEDILHPNGLFNPSLRFAFTNITEEPFTSYWSGQPITIKPGATVELTHHLAVKLTKELVDKIMIGSAKLNETEYYKNNPNTEPNRYRAASSLGIPAARKVWEDKIVRLLAPDEEDPRIAVMRAELKAELEANANRDATAKEPVHVPTSLSEFSELGKIKDEKKDPLPIKLKEIKNEAPVSK